MIGRFGDFIIIRFFVNTFSCVSGRFSPRPELVGEVCVRLRKHLPLHVMIVVLWLVWGLLVLTVVLVLFLVLFVMFTYFWYCSKISCIV